jgi:hypothetical protein
VTVYVVLRCFGYEPGSVEVYSAHDSEAGALADARQAETADRADTRDAYDAFWIEPVEVVQDADG